MNLLRLLKCQISRLQSYWDSFMANVRSKVAVTHRQAIGNKHTSKRIRHSEAKIHLPVMLAMLNLTYVPVRSTLSYLTSGREMIVHTYRKVDIMETPLRFSNPSFIGSRINQWAFIFEQDEPMPSLGKQELLKLCSCASEMPHQRRHLCPPCAGTGCTVTAGRLHRFHPWITNPHHPGKASTVQALPVFTTSCDRRRSNFCFARASLKFIL